VAMEDAKPKRWRPFGELARTFFIECPVHNRRISQEIGHLTHDHFEQGQETVTRVSPRYCKTFRTMCPTLGNTLVSIQISALVTS
jgi:hypothetical protein